MSVAPSSAFPVSKVSVPPPGIASRELTARLIRICSIRAGSSAIAGGVEVPLSPLAFGAFDIIRALSDGRNDEVEEEINEILHKMDDWPPKGSGRSSSPTESGAFRS